MDIILPVIIISLIILNIVGFSVLVAITFSSSKALLNLRVVRGIARFLCWIFGAPSEQIVLKYKDGLWNRYVSASSDVQNQDRALTFIERAIDRHINKARGILPFNSILLVVNGLELATLKNIRGPGGTDMFRDVEHLVLAALVISSVILLESFSARWPKGGSHADFREEFTHAVLASRKRTTTLNVAIVLSVASLLGMVAVGIASLR